MINIYRMKLSQKGLEFLKLMEGVRLKAYLCSAGVWTIYVGLTTINGVKVKEGQTITNADGEKELLKQILYYENIVNNNVKSNITQNMFDSLVSFVFNLGEGNFKKSTLLKKINLNPLDITIKNEFLKWCKAAGKDIPGLLYRRKKEADMYFL